jgi:hypothetical protein
MATPTDRHPASGWRFGLMSLGSLDEGSVTTANMEPFDGG